MLMSEVNACVFLHAQRRAQSFFTVFTENRGLAIDASSNDEQRASLQYILKIAVSPLIHAATASTKLLYNIYRKSHIHASTASTELLYSIYPRDLLTIDQW